MMNKKYGAALAAGLIITSSLALALPALADTDNDGDQGSRDRAPQVMMNREWRNDENGTSTPMMRPGINGNVSAINGTTLTLLGRGFGRGKGATTTYTIDASNVTVIKNGATTTLGSIVVNDRIFVIGTVNGTTVTANQIFVGMPGRGPGMMKGDNGLQGFQGNGQPVVAGTVASVTGSSFTLTNNNGATTYTVDASTAKVFQGHASSTVSSITVGDHVVVQGAVNGTSITASSVIDQPATNKNDNGNGDEGKHLGFFGSISHFFARLFHF